MKKFLILTVFILSIFIAKIDLYSQSFCYDQQGCSDWNYVGPQLIYTPAFPSCPIYAWFQTRVCNGVTQIYLNNLQVSFDSPGCDNLKNCIYPEGFGNPIDWGCVASVFEATYRQVSYLLFLEQTAGLTDQEKDQFLCGSGNFVKTHTYFRDICHKFCLKFVVGPSGPPSIYVVENICTNEYCCQVEEKYCYNKIWDPGQGKFVYFPNVQEVRTAEAWVNCDEIEPVSAPCPEGYHEEAPCRASCEIPE